MPSYAAAIPRPPRTLTELEQATLLKVTGEHRSGYRDHVIFAVALGTGLREHEIAALDVGDVLHDDGRVRRRIALRVFKRSSTELATQEVFLPDGVWYKRGRRQDRLGKLVSWKRGQGESLAADAPLFVSRRGRRISTRTLRYLFAVWQQRAGFDRPFSFHSSRK
jgi:integrase